MKNVNFMKLLLDKKVIDSYQYFTSCQYKLSMSKLCYRVLKKLIEKYQKEESEIIENVFKQAKETGKGEYKLHRNVVDYFGIEVDTTVVIEKHFFEIIGLLHSFFDIFAQWINASLFGEKALPIKKANIYSVVKEMDNFPEYNGDFITAFLNIIDNPNYIYISDFNNVQKHRYQLFVQNKINLISAQGEVNFPDFGKDKSKHIKTDALDMISKILDYCINLLADSKEYIETYYDNNQCNYVEHRIYNPETYIVFEKEEDFEKLINPTNHYYYIYVDSDNILPEYHILLVRDDSSKENEVEKNIELFNSPYQIIMLKDKNTDRIVGILNPNDTETYKLKDEHNLIYRKYTAKTSNFEHEMFTAICTGEFKYYPLLSNSTIIHNIKKQ